MQDFRVPKPGIEQLAENSTLTGGMQAIQGDGNIQQQNSQEVLKDVRVGGNLITGNITQINQVLPTQKLNPPNNLQFTGSANFVGRAHELARLHENLQRTGATMYSTLWLHIFRCSNSQIFGNT